MNFQTPIDLEGIKQILPHRYPFLFLDRILEIDPGRYCKAMKNVSGNELFLQGHFPNAPVFPGVLVVEALAQAGGILIYFDRANRQASKIFFAGIEHARFRSPIVPGDQIILETTLKKHRLDLWVFDGVASVGNKVVAEAELKVVVR